MSSELTLPTVFGIQGTRLLLEAELGSGGMGTVYRGQLEGPGGFTKRVAVKTVQVISMDSSEFSSLFTAEMNLCSKLSHKNIVQVFLSGFQKNEAFLVMEYLDGVTLRTLAKAMGSKGIGAAEACYVISEAAKGLAYAHGFRDPVTKEPLNVVHRDISPQNIMVTYDGSIKLIDFGIAKFEGRAEITRSGVVRGKASYMSPEQIEGKELDQRSDIFSLGTTFYELLTGVAPFRGRNLEESAHLVRTLEVAAPSRVSSHVPEALDWTVMSMLNKDLSERSSSCQGVADALDRYLHYQHPHWTSRNFFDSVEVHLK